MFGAHRFGRTLGAQFGAAALLPFALLSACTIGGTPTHSDEPNADADSAHADTLASTASLADAVVENVAFDRGDLKPGETGRWVVTVRNQGTAITGNIVGVAFFVGGAYVGFAIGQPLAAGASVTLSMQQTWTVPTSPGANLIVDAVVDDINRFPESNEANNALRRVLTVGGTQPEPQKPDAIIESITFDRAAPLAGDKVVIAAQVFNQGKAATGADVGVAFFAGDAYVGWGIAKALAAGGKATISLGQEWKVPQGVTSLKIKAVVDDVNRFAESDESNNARETTLTIASAPPPAPNGRCATIYGLSPSVAPIEALKDLGVCWVRQEWLHWVPQDQQLAKLRSYRDAGLNVLLLVDYATLPNQKPSSATLDGWDAYIDAFAERVRAVAGLVGNNVDAWEVWNEPNMRDHDMFGVPKQKFARLLTRAAAAIRQHSTAPPLIVGGMTYHVGDNGPEGYFRQVMTDGAGLPQYAGIGVHPYNYSPAGAYYNTMIYVPGTLQDFYARWRAVAGGKKLWVTEIGTVQPLQDDVQAKFVRESFQVSRAATDVGPVFWYKYDDDHEIGPGGVTMRHGLTTLGGASRKPSYAAYRALTKPL